MPKTLGDLIEEHIRLDLDAYSKAPSRDHWGNAKRVAFLKRQYLYKKIEARVSFFCS